MRAGSKIRAALCLACTALVLAGCRADGGQRAGKYCIYYLEPEETRLVQAYEDLKAESVEGKIEETLKLLAAPEEEDYESVFPNRVWVDSWELEDTELTLYFNAAYGELEPAAEVLLRAATVQSLVQIPGVDYLRFYVGDAPLQDKSGRDMGYMRAEDFVQNTGSSLHSYQTANLTLYFSGSAGNSLVAEEVSVRYNSNMSVERLIVEKLMSGPTMEGNKSVIPTGTKVLSVSVRDGVCYVNFDDGFLKVADGVEPRITIYALVNSIAGGGETSQVQILVNGETNINYHETIDLSKPLSRDLDLIGG